MRVRRPVAGLGPDVVHGAEPGALRGHGADRPLALGDARRRLARRPLLLRQAARARLRDAAAVRRAGRQSGPSGSHATRAIRAEPTAACRGRRATLPVENYGYDRRARVAAREAIADDAPMTWALGLLGVLLPALVLLSCSLAHGRARRAGHGHRGGADARRRDDGPAVLDAVLLAHRSARCSAFAAFALVWREREGPSRPCAAGASRACSPGSPSCASTRWRSRRSSSACTRSRGRGARRSCGARAAYGAGVVAGVAPLLAYQWWAFGSPLHTTYVGAVATDRLQRPRRARAQRRRLLRHHGAAHRRRAVAAVQRPRAADARAGARRGDRGRRRDAPLRPHRAEARTIAAIALALPRLQRRLLAAVRRRLAGPALPHPDPAVPRARARRRRGGAGRP